MNTQYRKNLKAVAQACKDYTDKTKEDILWQVGEYSITTSDDNTTAYQKTVPANATRCKIKRIYGNSVKYAPTTASDTTSAYQKNVPSYSPSIDRASANINTLGGMSYKVNQLYNVTRNTTVFDINCNCVNGVVSITGTSNGTGNGASFAWTDFTATNGHKFLITKDFDLPTDWFIFDQYNANDTTNIINTIFTVTAGFIIPQLKVATNGTTVNITNGHLMIFDLTAMEIDTTSLDTAIAGLLARGINPYEPNAYDSGSIRDTAPTSVVSKDSNNTTIDNLTIDNHIKALEGYGWGVNSTCYNYIDFNAKKFIKKANKYTFTGNENCGKIAGTTPLYFIRLEGAKNDNSNALLTSPKWHMSFVDSSSLVGTYGVEIEGNNIYFQPPSDVITTEAQLLTDITGLTIEYELATPVETDISAYLTTNEIEIEPNGTLSFESTYSAYVPSNVSYNGVIKHALATAVKLEGANLFDLSSLIEDHTSWGRYKLYLKPNTTYILSGIATSSQGLIFYDENNTLISSFTINNVSSYSFTTPSNESYTIFDIDYNNNQFMLNYGSTALPYRPHKATVTRNLPYQASDGWGIGSIKNVRDFTINKRGTNIGNKDLGLLDWIYYSEIGHERMRSALLNWKRPSASNIAPNGICPNLNVITPDQLYLHSNEGITKENDSDSIFVYTSTMGTNGVAFKNSINGVPLFYELNDEHKTESDITAIDNILVVEEGDTLTFVNSEGLPVPSDLTYRIEVARV